MANYSLDRGSLLHHVLAHYYNLKMQGVEEQEAVELAVEEGRINSLEIEGLLPHQCAEIYFQFREYCRYWSEDGRDKFVPIEGGIERPFVKKIYEDDDLIIALQGIIDFLGRQIGTDNLVILDHKGMRQRTNYSLLRNQFKNYCLGAEVDTLYVNKIGFQKTLPPAERFTRQRIVYSQDHLDEQLEVLISDGKMMLAHHKAEYYPPNFTSCDKFAGCQFKEEFCESRPDARIYKIGTHFKIGNRWDVGKVLEGTSK